MICPNPNCKSNIPDDSNYCPDCGISVKKVVTLREEAKAIVEAYKKGYNFFVSNGSLPRYTYNIKAENCEKIIAWKSNIVKKQNELLAIEKKEQERVLLESLRKDVRVIFDMYRKGYESLVDEGKLPPFIQSLTKKECESIIKSEQRIINKNNELIEAEKEREKLERIRFAEAEIRKNAKEITKDYPRGYEYFVNAGVLPPFSVNLGIISCNSIIQKLTDIKNKDKEIYQEKIRYEFFEYLVEKGLYKRINRIIRVRNQSINWSLFLSFCVAAIVAFIFWKYLPFMRDYSEFVRDVIISFVLSYILSFFIGLIITDKLVGQKRKYFYKNFLCFCTDSYMGISKGLSSDDIEIVKEYRDKIYIEYKKYKHIEFS